MVSDDCSFLLLMEHNGDLRMYGMESRRRLVDVWPFLWNTNTSIFNYSGESVPKFQVDVDGTLSVWEFVYKNVPSITPYLLWSTATNITGNDVVLTLSDSGCLSLSGDTDDMEWELCPTFEEQTDSDTETSTTTSHPIVTDSVVTEDAVVLEEDGGLMSNWWAWILLLISVALVIWMGICVKRCYFDAIELEKGWTHSDDIIAEEARRRQHIAGLSMDHSNSSMKGDYETEKQLELWSKS